MRCSPPVGAPPRAVHRRRWRSLRSTRRLRGLAARLSVGGRRVTRCPMGKQLIPPRDGEIEEIALREALEERYLQYALSTITGRALPDARDGLKPVHRRHALRHAATAARPRRRVQEMRPSRRRRHRQIPSARRSGDLRRAGASRAGVLPQRYPLVDGQGNFGNVDGDNPAAYALHRGAPDRGRAPPARRHRRGRDRFPSDLRRPVRDEPVVLPGAFPNLLANGSQGIAVGMATSIPPHNAAELCDAALHLIDTPNARSRTLLKYVPGPDFPTGGVIVDPPDVIAEAYTTGRGSFRVRARWHKEDTGRGTYLIVVTEIPWQVQKGRLVEKIAELLNERKLPLVADVRDEFRRGHPPRDRAALAHGRCRAADGIAVQAHRAREPHSAQHERAGEGPHSQGRRPRGGAQRMARPSPRGAGAARPIPPEPDRPSPRSARRLISSPI